MMIFFLTFSFIGSHSKTLIFCYYFSLRIFVQILRCAFSHRSSGFGHHFLRLDLRLLTFLQPTPTATSAPLRWSGSCRLLLYFIYLSYFYSHVNLFFIYFCTDMLVKIISLLDGICLHGIHLFPVFLWIPFNQSDREDGRCSALSWNFSKVII